MEHLKATCKSVNPTKLKSTQSVRPPESSLVKVKEFHQGVRCTLYFTKLPERGEDVEEEQGEDDDAGPKLEEADEEGESDSPALGEGHGIEDIWAFYVLYH